MIAVAICVTALCACCAIAAVCVAAGLNFIQTAVVAVLSSWMAAFGFVAATLLFGNRRD